MTDHCPSSLQHTRPRSRHAIALRRSLMGAVACAFVVTSACNDEPSGPDCADAVENTVEAATFAPSLDIDVASLTKNNANVYYKDLVVGTGPIAEAGDGVRVSYTGWFVDGTQFDAGSNFQFVIGLSQVILGWHRGVEGMQVGGRRILVLPPSVAYGLCGFRSIPGNSILVFQIDVLEVVDN